MIKDENIEKLFDKIKHRRQNELTEEEICIMVDYIRKELQEAAKKKTNKGRR